LHFSLKTYRQISKTIRKVLLVVAAMVFVEIGCAANFSSVQSGDWADDATWGRNDGVYPQSGDNVTINGHEITYNGDLEWTYGEISGNIILNVSGDFEMNGGSWGIWGTFIINTGGDFRNEIGGLATNGSSNFNIGGDLSVNGDLTLNNGDVWVGGDCDVQGSVTVNTGYELSVKGTLDVENSVTLNSGVIDIDGNVESDDLTVHGGIFAIEGNLTTYNSLIVDNSAGDLIIVGDYNSNDSSVENTGGDIYVFGGQLDCSDSDCSNIKELDDWLSTTPGLPYLSSVTTEITTTGDGSITLSEDATVVVECWGAGGSGADVSSNNAHGGGGGGGAYASSILDLNAGTYNYYVGIGSSTSDAGEDTWFSSNTTVMAKGGNSVPTNGTTGAAGGAASDSYGDTKFSGGNGAYAVTTGNTKTSGGGGSSAGFSMNGRDGINQAGGEAPIGGGAGGAGGAVDFNGNPGQSPGGGGGGSATDKTDKYGGAGADGKIKITISTSPLVYFTSASTTQTEDATTLSIDINMTTTSSSVVSIPFSISGTAIDGGVDYTLNTSSPIEITSGNTTQSISITIIEDTEYEPDETVIIQLGTPTNASLGSPNTHTITIENDDPEPNLTLSVTPSSICIGEAFTLTATGAKCKDIDYFEFSNDNGNNWTQIDNVNELCEITHEPTSSGTYQYRAYDGKNYNESNIVTVSVNPLPQGNLTANGPFCAPETGQLKWTATKGTGPYTVIYRNETTANDHTINNVTSGVPFDVANNPVSATTTYTLQSVTDANGCSRSTDFSTDSATIEIEPLSATVQQVTNDNECPQLDPNLGFEPNNDGPYNAGSSEIQFQVQNNSPTATWSFDFDITDANGLTGFVVDSVNAAGNSLYNQDILNSSGTFSSIPAADDLITITARVKNIPGEQIEVDFNLTNISDSNGCSTDYSANRDTVIMNVMPVVGSFE
jgi:hypothetical protein